MSLVSESVEPTSERQIGDRPPFSVCSKRGLSPVFPVFPTFSSFYKERGTFAFFTKGFKGISYENSFTRHSS